MNFLKHVMQQLDDQSLGLLGAVLGENESKVRDGVKSAVPKILGAMVSATKVDQGRDMLWRELRDTDTTVASSFSKQMYYKDSQALVATGHDQLDGLIGAETNRLIRSVSRESDIGSTSAKRLVGAVTPLVFASVANHQQSKQLNQNELGAVLEQQKHHLSDWERQSDHYFSSAYNHDEENEPLFSDLPKVGGSAATATAVASASLGAHHFRNRDLQSDAPNNDSDPTHGVQRSESDQGFDQRSRDRRHRKPIAVNPANFGFGANPAGYDHDQPSKSTAAGAVAAAGAAAVGAAGVAAVALTPSAKTTTGDPSINTNSGRSDSSTTNTYDSKNAVSGFAAADPGNSVKAGQAETYDGNAGHDANSRLWTPDTAQQRSADGTLQYSNQDATTNTAETASAAGKQSGGWFHWLWWPVLILGSLLALSLMFLNLGAGNSQPNGQDLEPSVAATSEGESTSGEPADATELIAVNADSEGSSEKSNSDILTSSIQITPSESDATTEPAAEANDPFNESSIALGTADSNKEGGNGSALNLQNSDSPMPNATAETTAEPNASNQDEVPSLEGSIEVDETAVAKNGANSDGENGDSAEEGANPPVLAASDLEMDADEQVEKLLSAIETELEEVNDETQAKAAEKSLTEHISGLEKVLADRAQWEDEIEILVDFQLEEGQKMLTQAGENISQSEAVKKILEGKLKELNALMKTTNDSQ